jgi:hypothetical protein
MSIELQAPALDVSILPCRFISIVYSFCGPHNQTTICDSTLDPEAFTASGRLSPQLMLNGDRSPKLDLCSRCYAPALLAASQLRLGGAAIESVVFVRLAFGIVVLMKSRPTLMLFCWQLLCGQC